MDSTAFKIHHRILILIAFIFNAFGFLFRLFVAPGPYDEIAHLITPFIGSYLLYTRARNKYQELDIDNETFLLLALASMSIAVCVLWEAIEWIIFMNWPVDPTHTLDDTMSDLIYGAVGSSSILLVAYVKQQLIKARLEKKKTQLLPPLNA